MSIAAFTLFSFLLLGINYLSLRWTGADISVGLLLVLYMVAVIIIMLPGIIAAFVVDDMLGESGGEAAGLGILSLWELLAALGCFALSKGMLNHSDMPVLRTGKR